MRIKLIFGFLMALFVLAMRIDAAADVPGTYGKTEVVAMYDVDNVVADVATIDTDVGHDPAKDVFLSAYPGLQMYLSQEVCRSESPPDLAGTYGYSFGTVKDNIAKAGLSKLKRGYVKRHIGAGDFKVGATKAECFINWCSRKSDRC